MPDGQQLVAPRALARTVLIAREVVAVPDGFVVQATDTEKTTEPDDQLSEDEASRQDFMLQVTSGLVLDDPDQPTPRVTPKGWLFLYMPAPASSCWIGVLDQRSSRKVGIRLSSNVNTVGEAAIARIATDWLEIRRELGDSAQIEEPSPGRFRIGEMLDANRDASPQECDRAAAWLRERLRTYVTALRPRIRAAVDDLKER